MVGDAYFRAKWGREKEFLRGDLAPSGIPDQTWTIGNIDAGTLGAITGGPPTVAPFAVLSAWRVGTAFDKTIDPEVCIPAAGHFTGFCTRMIVLNPGAQMQVAIENGMDPLPQPMTGTLGMKTSLVEPGVGEVCEYECEPSVTNTSASNSRVITQGTGAIAANTAKGTMLSFKNGRLYIAQVGDTPYFKIVGNNAGGGLPGIVDPVNNWRIEVEFLGKNCPVLASSPAYS